MYKKVAQKKSASPAPVAIVSFIIIILLIL